MLLMAVCMTALTAVSFTSCSKDDDPVNPDYSNVQNSLQGTWKGSYATMYINGSPAGYEDLIMKFEGNKLTLTQGETVTDYTYSIKSNGELMYISFDDHAVFFEISGNKLKIVSTDGTFLYFAIGTELIKQ